MRKGAMAMNDYINRADALEACHPVMPTDGVGTIGLTMKIETDDEN